MKKVVIQRQLETNTIKLHRKQLFHLPDLHEIKEKTKRKSKIYGYLLLVTTIKLYIKGNNLAKQNYRKIKNKIKKTIQKYNPRKKTVMENKEISKFFQKISNYKKQLHEIKEQIEKEENLN